MAGRGARRELLVALLLAAAACGPAGGGPSQPSHPAAPPPATSQADGTIPCRPSLQSAATGKLRFTTPARRDGEVVVMPLVFPDGTTAELRYPPELELAKLGVWPRTSGAIGKEPSTGRDLLIVYGDAEGLTAGTAPAACYPGAERGQAELWRSQDPDVRYWLLFRVGAWTVAMWDGNAGRLMGHQDRAVWARSLVGRETGRGWLVLRGRRPLRLGAEHEGDGAFGRAVIQGLQVRNVRHAFPPGRYQIVP